MDSQNRLLQVGSNLFELIEFTVTRSRTKSEGVEGDADKPAAVPSVYGVNVAKVREVIRLPHIVPCLTSCPEVLGVFNLRGLPVPAIHLAKVLGASDEPVNPASQVIVTEFSKRVAGFVVSSTRRIRRVGWDKVLPPSSEAFSTVTGMILIENGSFLFMLDFEQILLSIEARSGVPQRAHLRPEERQGEIDWDMAPSHPPKDAKIRAMIVDDSPIARRAVCDMMRNLGLCVVEFSDGEQAWNALTDPHFMRDMGGLDIVISDVEMPRLDGYSLVKRIRADSKLAALPIVLHSSLTGEVNRERARLAGANAYVCKFNKKEIVEALRQAFPGMIRAVKEAS